MKNGSPIPSPAPAASSCPIPCWLSDIPSISVSLLIPLLLLSACSSPRRPAAPEPAAALAGGAADAGTPREWVPVHGQYAFSGGAPGANPVFEVYLTNTGRTARLFTGVELNGRSLDDRPPTAEMPGYIHVDGVRFDLPVTRPDDREVLWWDFLPGPEVPPGRTAVLAVLFSGVPRPHGALVVRDSEGGAESVRVPRCTPGQPAVTAVAFSRGGARIFLKTHSAGGPPSDIWVDGRRAAGWGVFEMPAEAQSRVVALDAPAPLRPGAPVDVRVRFGDGRERRAAVRALDRMTLDMPGGHGPTMGLAKSLRTDADPLASPVPVDACCGDLRAGAAGACAWDVVGERRRMQARDPGKLAGFAYCTAATPESWRVYGHIADAVYAKPYRFGWGNSQESFLDEEQEWVGFMRDTAAPLPFFYIPERFRKGGRFLRPAELEAACWTALLMGAKDIRYHFGLNAQGLDDTPDLIPAIAAINGRVRELEAVLCQLIPAGGVRQPIGNDGHVVILTAWAVDHGALFLVRDATPGALGAEPPPTRRDLVLPLPVPAWCQDNGVVDLSTGGALACIRRPDHTAVTLPEMSGWRLLWAPARVPWPTAVDGVAGKSAQGRME